MNLLDIVVLTIIGSFVALGLWKGLIKQLFSLAGIIIGYIAAISFYEQISTFFTSLDKDIASIVSFIAIFVSCILLSSLVGLFVGKLIKIADLSWLNRVAGGLLGFLKGLLILMIIVVILVAFLPSESKVLRNSVTLPYVMSVAQVINNIIPMHIKDNFEEKLEELRSYWLQKEIKKFH